jgi:hypothetical protein
MLKLRVKSRKREVKNDTCVIVLLFVFCVLNSLGCAKIKEGIKGFAGVSTDMLEKGREQAIKKTFSYDFNACHKKGKEALLAMGAYIYAENKEMIAVYVSSEDTTPVGVFFKMVNLSNTRVEVSSPSIYAKEFIANKLFSVLGGESGEKKE